MDTVKTQHFVRGREQVIAEPNKCLRGGIRFLVFLQCPSSVHRCVHRASAEGPSLCPSLPGLKLAVKSYCADFCAVESRAEKANLSLQLAVRRYVLMSVPLGAERKGELKSQLGRQTLLCVWACVYVSECVAGSCKCLCVCVCLRAAVAL